jgi:hypothetical protein
MCPSVVRVRLKEHGFPARDADTSRQKVVAELAYQIEYSPEVDGHLRALTARQRATVFDAVDEQLTHQPNIETRNRKPMRPNPVAPWELRVGTLRVYDDIEDIHLKFNDGAEGFVDLAEELYGEMFAPLKDVAKFKAFRVDAEFETIVWDNGADLAPEFLHARLLVAAEPEDPRDRQ